MRPPVDEDNLSAIISAYDEVQTALLLVLSCAVHCSHREAFIDNIQRLSVDVQEAIVYYIKQVNSLTPPNRLCVFRRFVFRRLVGWLVVTRVHCGQTVHPRPIVTMEH